MQYGVSGSWFSSSSSLRNFHLGPLNFISEDSKLKPKVIISFLKERMWSVQIFPLDSLLELPLTSPFFIPANLFPPDQLWLCDHDRSLTWPLLLCCLYIPSNRVLASFLVLQFGSQLPWGLTETTLAPVLSFQRDIYKSIQKCCPIWWRWPQVNGTE